MNNPDFFLTSIITVCLAFVGYFVKYLNDLRIEKRKAELELSKEKRKAELERINKQLQFFYGPLKALNDTSSLAYTGFSDKYLGTSYFSERFSKEVNIYQGSKDKEERDKNFRLWMKTVFFPIQQQMMETILSRLDLLIEDEIPQCLELICAHVAAYKPIINKWENGDYTDKLSVILYPGEELTEYLSASFKKLKKRQKELLLEIKN